MFYREAGQFKTSYQADNQIFPLRQDRIGVALLLCAAFLRCHCSPLITLFPRSLFRF
jgi:hypothetical protein